ncbi:phosphotransferase enzyme family protein [Mucilaginibacter pedocola]|uniref:Desulfatase n=1 Tax=Mucilaginibacter pedocola TaxID=1792845 RepID=A0A1S9PF01_9SPHI|nr:aminoglycoside phosphotransferase family protein [Mucilaginibacter pedocola]OOQ59534.1 desulfatase [Mucilaginibacter pedocola]
MSLTGTNTFNITAIVKHFNIAGEIAGAEAFGNGHINDTFWLKNQTSGCPDYLLQRINHHVFKDVPGLIENIRLVTAYLNSKMPGEDSGKSQKVLKLIDTTDGELFHRDADGNYWRVYLFLAGSRSYDIVLTEQQAYEGGKAFGYFQTLLSDMDPQQLSETIVDFHNIRKRLRDLHKAIVENAAGRVDEVNAEIKFVSEREKSMAVIYDQGCEGLLPKRITHNDTKFNNILFDADDKAECVIDLDTVMPGHVAYDFGDAIRTIINTAAEDEPDLDKIQINIPLFKAYAEGYINEAHAFLTDAEVESLFLGAMLLPYMQGVRFLTDYLQGDTYFKTAYPGHNVVRARAQFKLLTKLEEQATLLRQIIIDTVAAHKSRYKEEQNLG